MSAPAKKAASKQASHPPYAEMVLKAIVAVKEKKGCTRPAMRAYIKREYGIEVNAPALKRALEKLKQTGRVTSPNQARFKVDKAKIEAEKASKKKKTASVAAKKKKPAAKKSDKSAVKKATTPKKKVKKAATVKKTGAATKKAAVKKTTKKPASKKAAAKKKSPKKVKKAVKKAPAKKK